MFFTKLAATTLLSITIIATAHAQSREQVIEDALRKGAHIVRCVKGQCHDEQTGEYVGDSNQDGAFLVFPNDPASQYAQNQTAKALKYPQ